MASFSAGLTRRRRALFYCHTMKKDNVRIAIAQVNSTVGDLEGNSRKVNQYLNRLKGFGVDIVSFPELMLTGYPPEDLLLKPKFVSDSIDVLKSLARDVGDVVVVVGFVDKDKHGLYNAAAVLYQGKICGVYRKILLPNYGVFDEKRYFSAGSQAKIFRAGDLVFGVNICEDIWHEQGPLARQAKLGAGLIVNINASPYHAGKVRMRQAILQKQARAHKVFISYVNLVGGQDELVFDGQSMVISAQGRLITRAEAFKEDLLITDINPNVPGKKPAQATVITQAFSLKERAPLPAREIKSLEPEAEVYQALVLGLHDYVVKNGFQKVVVGLSGGVDSALVATLAADALGKENVIAVFMPSHYSSRESQEDARYLAENLGVKLIQVPIEQIYRLYLLVLEPHFMGSERDITEENLQARIRGNLLMAFSNKFGWLVLTTGNKSEMSTGYATLYGDMAGGFAVIKDIPKVLVYRLCRYRNSLGFVIPDRVLTKAPTAELKPQQKDSDSLPVYDELDPILKAYIEEDKGISQIVSLGYAPETVSKVIAMVDKSEYKRRQAPPGIKITPKAFGKDRRMPITNKYRG